MAHHSKRYHRGTKRCGGNIFKKALDKLPVELHWPGYNFLGPGTNLNKRRTQNPLNLLDAAAKEHDLAYESAKNTVEVHRADRILENKAWDRFKDSRANFIQERVPAYIATNLIKLKRKLGFGIKPKSKGRKGKRHVRGAGHKRGGKIKFSTILKESKAAINKNLPVTVNIARSLKAALKARKNGKNIVGMKRIIPLPKQGGVLPIVPILGAIAAAGLIGKGVTGVADGISSIINLKRNITGSGLYAQPASYYKNKASFPTIGKGIRIRKKGGNLSLLLPLLRNRLSV